HQQPPCRRSHSRGILVAATPPAESVPRGVAPLRPQCRTYVAPVSLMRKPRASGFAPAGRCPVVDRDLTRPRQGQLPVRRMPRNGRTGANGGARPDLDGRYQLHVGADERMVTDCRDMLVYPVVIAGDDAGADIDIGADVGITDIAQMIDLAATAQRRLLR